MRGNCSIEHDKRDFWHVNFFIAHEDLGDDGDIPDAHATTKKGATRDDAIALAKRRFKPTTITVWDACQECGGTGMSGDTEDEYDECGECEDGNQPSILETV